VQKMGELSVQRPSIQFLGTMPAAGGIIALIPIPETMDGNQKNIPQDLFVHKGFQPYGWWGIAILHDREYLSVLLLRQVNDFFGFPAIEAHGFFDEYMFSGMKAGDGLPGM